MRNIETGVTLIVIVINFAHPLTDEQLREIQTLLRVKVTTILKIPSQIDAEMPLDPQIEKMLDEASLTPDEWQTCPILINLPSLNFSTAVVLAKLHGRMGYFPPVLRLRPHTAEIPHRYAVTEVLNLQAMRDKARKTR